MSDKKEQNDESIKEKVNRVAREIHDEHHVDDDFTGGYCPHPYGIWTQELWNACDMMDAPLTEEKVRGMVPRLEFWKTSKTKNFINFEAKTSLGGYRVRESRNDDECFVDFGWGLEGSMFTGTLFVHGIWETREDAFIAAQKDYEDRVLRALGFEPKKEEG